MYIQRLNHTDQNKHLLTVRHDNEPQNHNLWHYHDELEFIHIKKGRGTLFVGDRIQQFTDDYTVLIGANTPHYWLFDDEYTGDKPSDKADIIAVHFRPNFIGNDFMQSEAAKPIRDLYVAAQRVLSFETYHQELTMFFRNVIEQHPLKRLVSLLNILIDINHTCNYSTLVSQSYSNPLQEHDHLRMNKVLEHIRVNYRSHIYLYEIAQLAGMTSNSFCRYFKQKTGKTLVQFINEIRVSQACKLLTNSEKLIKSISFECGFQNFASFHKKFKEITGQTPTEFRTTNMKQSRS